MEARVDTGSPFVFCGHERRRRCGEYGEGEAVDRCDERDQDVELSYLKRTREVDARTLSRGIMFISEPIDTSRVWKPA